MKISFQKHVLAYGGHSVQSFLGDKDLVTDAVNVHFHPVWKLPGQDSLQESDHQPSKQRREI